ncbi:putative phage terminase large subunit-like protein [Lysobacter niastensis]|uniref:Phage terminase large subunit-like protein n=1 Tax=Lysobacter niastensis TaxID=380629 RepID=A0ABU1WC73_9GAMM|nr:putative phage terminase large subunit-like protein [Lysobacter niastensis]
MEYALRSGNTASQPNTCRRLCRLAAAGWLAYYTPDETPEYFDTIVQSWDTANKESELADYSVCTTWGVKGKKSYLLHVLRKRMAYPDLKRAVIAQAEAWKARTILIEDKASGIQLVQELRGTVSGIKGIKCEGDKIMRMLAQTPEIENGHVLLPKQAPWLPDYVQELTTFPKGKYDDQVDSTAQALKWITVEGREPGIITYYKQLIAKQRGLTMDEVENQLRAGRTAL